MCVGGWCQGCSLCFSVCLGSEDASQTTLVLCVEGVHCLCLVVCECVLVCCRGQLGFVGLRSSMCWGGEDDVSHHTCGVVGVMMISVV